MDLDLHAVDAKEFREVAVELAMTGALVKAARRQSADVASRLKQAVFRAPAV